MSHRTAAVVSLTVVRHRLSDGQENLMGIDPRLQYLAIISALVPIIAGVAALIIAVAFVVLAVSSRQLVGEARRARSLLEQGRAADPTASSRTTSAEVLQR